jgi:hypothetical protein
MALAPDLAARLGWNQHKAADEVAGLASELAPPAPADKAVGY